MGNVLGRMPGSHGNDENLAKVFIWRTWRFADHNLPRSILTNLIASQIEHLGRLVDCADKLLLQQFTPPSQALAKFGEIEIKLTPFMLIFYAH